jgi:hypothetical protein
MILHVSHKDLRRNLCFGVSTSYFTSKAVPQAEMSWIPLNTCSPAPTFVVLSSAQVPAQT